MLTATPYAKIFEGHAVAKYDGVYYDPSYGVIYSGVQDLENKAIDGYGVFESENPADIITCPPAFSVPIFGEVPYP